jgi:predicted nucleic acid-binding protein
VLLKAGPLEELAYEIADIQSKYVAAFQQTMSHFTTWFPNNRALYRVEVKDNDPSKMLALLDARYQQTTQALALYRGGGFPLGMFAHVVGSSLVAVWSGMVSRLDGRILAASGTTQDAQREAELLSGAQAIVLDLTALLTLAHLDLLERLPRRFMRIVVPRAVIDEITEVLIRDFSDPVPVMTAWKERDRYVRQDITPESIEQGRKFLERIRAFVESAAEVVPTTKALELGKGDFEKFQEMLGRSGIASILVAKEHGILLYSDDLWVRGVAKNDWQVDGVWSQTVVMSLQNHNIPSQDDYHQAVVKLVLSNYRFVSINVHDLRWLLKRHDMKITKEMIRAFELLHGPDCNEESAIRVIADLIRSVWLEVLLYHQKRPAD